MKSRPTAREIRAALDAQRPEPQRSLPLREREEERPSVEEELQRWAEAEEDDRP